MEFSPEMQALLQAREMYLGQQPSKLGVEPLAPPEMAAPNTLEQPVPDSGMSNVPAPEPALQSASVSGSRSVATSRPVRRNDVPDAPTADFGQFAEASAELAQERVAVNQQQKQRIEQKREAELGIDSAEESADLQEYAATQNMMQAEQHFAANRDAKLAQQQARIDQAMAEISSVNPGGAWKNAGALGSAAGIISAAIGGYLSVRMGTGTNSAMDQINKMIETDVKAQEQDIWNQKFKIQGMQTAKEDLYKDAALQKAERAEQFAYRKASIAAETRAAAAKFKSAKKQAEYFEAADLLDMEAIKHRDDAVKEAAGYYENQFTSQYNAWKDEQAARNAQETTRIGWMNARTARMGEERAGKATEAPEVTPALVHPTTGEKFLVDPQRAAVLNKADYTAFDAVTAERYDILDRAKRAFEIMSADGETLPWGAKIKGLGSADKARAQALVDDVADLVLRARSGAAAPVAETEKLAGFTAKRDTFFTVGELEVLSEFLKSQGGDQARRAKQLGLTKQTDGKPHDWAADFKMPKIVTAKATTAKDITSRYRNNVAADVAGLAGEPTKQSIERDMLNLRAAIKDPKTSIKDAREAVKALEESRDVAAEQGNKPRKQHLDRLIFEAKADILKRMPTERELREREAIRRIRNER